MTTLRQARNSRFQRGSAVYNCAVCGRSTRDTGHGNDAICEQCWDLAGEQNSLSDSGELYAGVDSVRDTFNLCVTRGGSVEKLLNEFSDVAEAAGWTGPTAKTSTTTVAQKETNTMFNLKITSTNGLRFEGIVAAASAADAIKEGRAAVKLAGINRSVGRIDYRAKLAK